MHGQGVAARARLRNKSGQIPSSIPNERSAFFSQSCNYHFAQFPRFDRLEGVRVDDFQDVIISPIVNALMFTAVETGAGTVQFSEAWDVKDVVNSKKFLDTSIH
jgi:hypothetical protein